MIEVDPIGGSLPAPTADQNRSGAALSLVLDRDADRVKVGRETGSLNVHLDQLSQPERDFTDRDPVISPCTDIDRLG